MAERCDIKSPSHSSDGMVTKGNLSAVGLLHDIIISQHARNAIQQLFIALSENPSPDVKDIREKGIELVEQMTSEKKWIDVLASLEGQDAQTANMALLKLILFLEAAREGEEAIEFFKALMEIGGVGDEASARAIVSALADEQVHESLGRLATTLEATQLDRMLDKEELSENFQAVVDSLKAQKGILTAATQVSGAMLPINSEGSMMSDMLLLVEKHVEESGQDLIGQLTKDPMTFAQTMIKNIVWPVLSQRLARIEVAPIQDTESKDTYAFKDIVVRVVELPERIQLVMNSTMDLVLGDDVLTNGGSDMTITLKANKIGALTDPISFTYNKISFPSFSDGGHLDVKILQPGLNLSVAIKISQPAGINSCPIFSAGDFQTVFNAFQ
eukprot:Ihof_evm2s717 gene=Ihof_evmTU2s717